MNAEQRRILEEAAEAWSGNVQTHHARCYIQHAGCLAFHLLALDEEDDE